MDRSAESLYLCRGKEKELQDVFLNLQLTLLVVQVEVAVFISASDRIRDAIPVWVVGVDDGDQRIRTSILTEEGLIPDGGNKKEQLLTP